MLIGDFPPWLYWNGFLFSLWISNWVQVLVPQAVCLTGSTWIAHCFFTSNQQDNLIFLLPITPQCLHRFPCCKASCKTHCIHSFALTIHNMLLINTRHATIVAKNKFYFLWLPLHQIFYQENFGSIFSHSSDYISLKLLRVFHFRRVVISTVKLLDKTVLRMVITRL